MPPTKVAKFVLLSVIAKLNLISAFSHVSTVLNKCVFAHPAKSVVTYTYSVKFNQSKCVCTKVRRSCRVRHEQTIGAAVRVVEMISNIIRR